MSIYLIRHGITKANQMHLYCGSTDLPLSAEGREALRDCKYQIPKDADYYSSGMLRCNETIDILFNGIHYKINKELREIDFGIFEMKSYNQLKEDPDYLEWISGNNEANIPPSGESGLQMKKRVISVLDDILSRENDVVLVTHGGVIATIMEHLFPEENKTRYQWQPKPGCGYLVQNDRYFLIP